jgi:hypothetical protein
MKKKIALFAYKEQGRVDYGLIFLQLLSSLKEKGYDTIIIVEDENLLDHYKYFYSDYKVISWHKLVIKKISKLKVISILMSYFLFYIRGRKPRTRNTKSILRQAIITRDIINDESINAFISLNYWTTYAGIPLGCYTMDIPSIALQHGDYYGYNKLAQSDECEPGRSHEWPASHVIVYSEMAKASYNKYYGNATILVGGYLNAVKYVTMCCRQNEKIIIYECELFDQFNMFHNYLICKIGPSIIFTKEHPYLKTSNLQRIDISKCTLYDLPLWQEQPNIIISLGSSIGIEAVRLGIPVVTISDNELGNNFLPYTFKKSDWLNAAKLVVELKTNGKTRDQVTKRQYDFLDNLYKENSVVIRDKIVETIIKTIG